METQRALYSGMSGTGKTTLAKNNVRNVKRLVILDPVGGEYGWANEAVTVFTWDQVYQELKKPTFRIIVDIDEEPLSLLIHVTELCLDEDVGNVTLVVDELFYFFPTKNTKPPEIIQRLFRIGRRRNVNVIFISQRPIDCPIDLRSQFTDFYTFTLVEPSDIKWLAGVMGSVEAKRVLALAWHGHYHWSVRGTRRSVDVTPEEDDDETGEDRPDRPDRGSNGVPGPPLGRRRPAA